MTEHHVDSKVLCSGIRRSINTLQLKYTLLSIMLSYLSITAKYHNSFS